MTELLPIIFARGQNEGIDPRVAPAEVHSIAQNVRWRKDGRPAKKYGCAAVSTNGLAPGSFNTQPVNAMTSWNGNPVIAIGSRVCQLSAALGWSAQLAPDDGELSHFGPGRRDIIARDEKSGTFRPSCGTASGLILYAWDNGTNVYYAVKGVNGETVVTPRILIANCTWPRCISTSGYIYILSKNGATLDLRVFDPATLAVTNAGSPGTLDAAGSYFDACGRGSDFVIIYQSAAVTATLKLFSAAAAPVLQQTQTVGITATATKLTVAGTSTSLIFAAAVETAGRVVCWSFNTGLTANLGGSSPETDVNNNQQPGLAVDTSSTAVVVWGGFVTATPASYMRTCKIDSTAAATTTIGTYPNVCLASKPFVGPAYSTMGNADGPYVWVATHNADNGSAKWDSQRAYYLLKFRAQQGFAPRRQLHAPGLTPDSNVQQHLSDVLALGTGYGFLTPLPNAIRFTPSIPLVASFSPLNGVDSVSARSIFESVAMATRDVVTAGRALQFSGGSLFELNGAAEETGFTNAPVILSATAGAGGALTSGANYIFVAVYEWLDNQGRRHRSAPSDPVTVAMGGNNAVTLVLATLVADAHTLNASGSSAGRGTVVHVYRTLANQSTFHRVTPDVGAPQASVLGTSTVSYTDLASDTIAAVKEILYTDGGVLPNTLCPPHTFMCVCNGRVWVGGQLDPSVITASKVLVDGEPTQFSDLESFSVFLPEACTGLASIDGTVIAFARERIYFITGDGPNDQGIGSFSNPTELPTDTGCIDWRSIVETSAGVFYQAKRGIFLLPRGFNTPIFVGAEVEDTLSFFPYIVDATFVSIPSTQGSPSVLGELSVRFVVATTADTPSSTRTLVYDLRTGGWSFDTNASAVIRSGTWSDSYITAQSLGSVALFSEQPNIYTDTDGNFIVSQITTGDIRPFGVAGFGEFKSVVLVGEYRGNARVTVSVSVDGAAADSFLFPVTGADAPDNSVYLDVTPKTARGSAIRITCYDQGTPVVTTPSEGFVMQALFIEHQAIGGPKRLAAARRA